MLHKFVLTLTAVAFGLSLGASTSEAAIASGKTAGPNRQPNALAQLTQAPTYLDGLTNNKFAAGSNIFARALKKDGSEEMRATLRLNAGASNVANITSVAPQKLHLSVFHVANKKTTETLKLNFKGLKTSEVGTRVLTFEAPAQNGRMIAKVQQEQAAQNLWKTTGTIVQFVPSGSVF